MKYFARKILNIWLNNIKYFILKKGLSETAAKKIGLKLAPLYSGGGDTFWTSMLYFFGCTETIYWRKHKEDLNVSNQFIVAMYLNLRFIPQRVSHANIDLGLVGFLD